MTVVFVELPNTKLELLHPLGDKSPISKFLQKNPHGGIHHICLEVADVRQSLKAVAPHMNVLDPEPKIGAHGNPVSRRVAPYRGICMLWLPHGAACLQGCVCLASFTKL